MITRVNKRHKSEEGTFRVTEKLKVQLVLKEKVKCVRGQITCEGENKGFRGEMKGTNAEEENEMFKGEIRGADSAEGRYEIHEVKM